MDVAGTGSRCMKPIDPIIYPRLKTLTSLIDNSRQQFGKTDIPERRILTGPVGVGKKTLIKHYTRQVVLTQDFADDLSVLVLDFSLPMPCTIEAAFLTMLYSLGRRTFFTYPLPQLADLVVTWLEKRRTELIVVRDFHHILSIRRKTELEKAKQYFYQVIRDAKVPTVFVYPAIETSKLLKLSNILAELKATETVLKPFSWNKDNPGSIEEFRYVVRAFEEKLAITLPWTEKNKDKFLARVYFATGGVMSLLAKLLYIGAYRAQKEKSNQISLELLDSIYEERLACYRSLKVSPFAPEWRVPKGSFGE